jgi:hypothetical protein
MTSRCRAALPALLAVALALPACGGGGGDAAGSSTTSPASSAASSASSSAPTTSSAAEGGAGSTGQAPPDTEDDAGSTGPFPANTDPDTGYPSSDARVTVTALRIGRHDGFDRVVFEAGGTGTPGWDVRYVDSANSQGSGADIAVEGGAILQVTLTGVGLPADTGVEEYSGPDRLASAAAQVVTEVVWDGTFEGQSVAFVGVSKETPFRVYSLKDPARVVLEVADPS